MIGTAWEQSGHDARDKEDQKRTLATFRGGGCEEKAQCDVICQTVID